MALTKSTVGTSGLWRQWQEKHQPQEITLFPATADNAIFDTTHVTPDDRADFDADRHRWAQGTARHLDTSKQAEQEAYWITRYESGDDRYRERLAAAGYAL